MTFLEALFVALGSVCLIVALLVVASLIDIFTRG